MALRGLRVLEFAGLAPGPLAGLILRDFGADVIRIDQTGHKRGIAVEWMSAGKRSIALDLKRQEGLHIARQLADKADVLIEPFRPGVMEKLSLGPDVLCGANPRLVYARITGWGQTGPQKDTTGHDINYLASTGLLAMLGRAGHPPQFPGNLLADFAGGSLTAVIGILMALYSRERSGRGQVVDVSMLCSTPPQVEGLAYVGTFIHAARAEGLWNGPRGTNLLDSGAPFYDTYPTKDGKYVAVGAIEPQFYAALVRGLGLDPANMPQAMDMKHWPELRKTLAAAFATKTRDEWKAVFDETDACVVPVYELDEYAEHPHTRAREGVRTVQTVRGPAVFPAPAPKLSDTPAVGSDAEHKDAGIGEHTVAVLRELGMAPQQIDKLVAEGVVETKHPHENVIE